MLRVVITDGVSTALCLFRIVTCLIRYVFYDLQVDSVDLALQKTYELESTYNSRSLNGFLSVLEITLDVMISIIQIILSLGKLALVIFLL